MSMMKFGTEPLSTSNCSTMSLSQTLSFGMVSHGRTRGTIAKNRC